MHIMITDQPGFLSKNSNIVIRPILVVDVPEVKNSVEYKIGGITRVTDWDGPQPWRFLQGARGAWPEATQHENRQGAQGLSRGDCQSPLRRGFPRSASTLTGFHETT